MNDKPVLIYEGKAKKIFDYSQDKIIVEFKDDVTAFNGIKKEQMTGKGVLNKKISSFFFNLVEKNGVKTHWIQDVDEKRFLARKLNIVQLEVVIRNYSAGSFCKRYGVKKGIKFSSPLFELFVKNDELNDPLITEDSAIELGFAEKDDIETMKKLSLKINKILSDFLEKKSILLADFKLEFGKHKNEIYLGDEISPDTCRFWDMKTMDSLDKDVYRNSTGNLVNTYEIFAKRVGIQ